MISLLPRRLRTADSARGHRPGGRAGGLGPRLAGIARMLSWLTLAATGIESGVAIGAAVVAGSAALPGSGPGRGIEAMASIIVIRRHWDPAASATSERHGSGPWPTGLAWLGAMDEPARYLSHIEVQRWPVRGPA
jgi:hypothetical protein